MKKLIVFLALMLIGLKSYSQDTIPKDDYRISITTDQAKEAIRNAQRVQSMSLEISMYKTTIIELQSNIEVLVGDIGLREKQLELARKNYEAMKVLWEAEKAKGGKDGYTWGKFKTDLMWFLGGGLAAVTAILAL